MTDFIVVHNLSKTYNLLEAPLQVIDDVTVSVRPGEILSIVGPSGCGKTTFLRILAGLIPSSSGKVTIDGDSPSKFRSTRGIGFVPQKAVAMPWRTLLSNILLPAEVRFRTVPDVARRRAESLLCRLGDLLLKN